MDKPETVRWDLHNFPTEVWTSITLHLPGEQLGRLKMTGSKAIWQRLTSPHVVKAIILGKGQLTFKKWPNFLNELPDVEEMNIDNASRGWWKRWKLNRSMVPKTLKKLKIRLHDTDLFFTKPHGLSPLLADHVPALESLDVDIRWRSDFGNLPSLTKLSLYEWGQGLPLPPSVTQLELDNVLDPRGRVLFPPHLISFSVSGVWSTQSLLRNLPPALRTLSIYGSERYALRASECADNLPRSLTQLGRLYFARDCFSDPVLEEEPSSFLNLPPSLTELDVNMLPSPYWAHLPQTLQILKIQQLFKENCRAYASNDPLTGDAYVELDLPFDSLPRSITFLSLFWSMGIRLINAPRESSNGEIAFFPPNLTYLNLERFQLTPAAAKSLPQSLKSLDTTNLDSQICSHLPNGLTRLSAACVMVNYDLIKFLPRSLTSLTLQFGQPQQLWIIPSISEETSVQKAAVAFPGAHSTVSIIPSGSDCFLPPKLKWLKLDKFDDIGDEFVYHELPELEHLELPDSRLLSDSFIPYLPGLLTTLKILKSTKITGKCFKDLPRTLLLLDLGICTQIFDEDIVHLPRDLNELCIKHATSLTNKCIVDMPRTLTSLLIDHNGKITSSCISHLPYNLRNNNFISAKFTTVRYD